MKDQISAVQRRILVVDDNPEDIILTRLAFKRAGLKHQVDAVTDGEAAMGWLQAWHPTATLVVLDLRMPKLSGLQVLQWIRCQPRLEGTAVVLLSGSMRDAEILQGYKTGANACLTKPADFELLCEMVCYLSKFFFD